MTYYASFGELLLIASLLLAGHKSFHSDYPVLARGAISSAMLFIAVTASFGVFRFAGVESVVAIHDTTSWLATHFAMPIYALFTASLFVANKRLQQGLIALFALNALLVMTEITLLTNVVLFIALAATAYFSGHRRRVIKAVVALLLVPVTVMLPFSQDLQMGLFHVLLACHFYLISEVYQTKYD